MRNRKGQFSKNTFKLPELSPRGVENVLAIGPIFCLYMIGFIMNMGTPIQVHAENAPSHSWETMNNHEACLYFAQRGAGIKGASLGELKGLCAKEGITL